jgi:hypothetical protein
MPFVVLYDANALYPNAQRDLLIRIARAGLNCLTQTTGTSLPRQSALMRK